MPCIDRPLTGGKLAVNDIAGEPEMMTAANMTSDIMAAGLIIGRKNVTFIITFPSRHTGSVRTHGQIV